MRDEYAAYDGVTAPKDDPFWDSFYPPCDFNCRCDVVEVAGDATATGQDIVDDLSAPAATFGQNCGKTGEIFSADHPYF